MLNVFAMADATTLTEAGYVAKTWRTSRRLLQAADYDVKRRKRHSYLDGRQISPSLESPSITRDVLEASSKLSCLMEGTVANVPPKEAEASIPRVYPSQYDEHPLICGGAFDGLEDIVAGESIRR